MRINIAPRAIGIFDLYPAKSFKEILGIEILQGLQELPFAIDIASTVIRHNTGKSLMETGNMVERRIDHHFTACVYESVALFRTNLNGSHTFRKRLGITETGLDPDSSRCINKAILISCLHDEKIRRTAVQPFGAREKVPALCSSKVTHKPAP